MPKKATKPRTRPRNAVKTRAAILTAGIKHFSQHAYGDVGLRDIARDAGSDVSLVYRYFGSKEHLYRDVLAELFHHEHLTSGPRETFGIRIASQLLGEEAEVRGIESVLLAVRAASSPDSVEIIKKLSSNRYIRPFAKWLGGSDAEMRAQFIAALMAGVAVHRNIANPSSLKGRGKQRYLERVAHILQSFVDDKDPYANG
ncbi:MAG: TetR family transcriptional regulator [Steroidobacteraceae bacterium]